MRSAPIKGLDEIADFSLGGIRSDQDIVLKHLKATLPLASELAIKAAHSSAMSPLALAAAAALHSVTSLMVVAAPKCNLGVPAADIDACVDGNGNLIYRCRHSLPHEWDLSGRPIP